MHHLVTTPPPASTASTPDATPHPAATLAARALVVAVWPTAWWLAQGTLSTWREASALPLTVDTSVGIAVMGIGAIVAGYLALISLALAASLAMRRARPPQWLRAATPQAWRRVVAVAVGGAISASLATGAYAAPVGGAPDDAPPVQSAQSAQSTQPVTIESAGWISTPTDALTRVDLKPVTDALPQTVSPAPASRYPIADYVTAGSSTPGSSTTEQSVATTAAVDTVKVRRGDSLWTICASLLPDSATEADIALAWPILYRANRAAIGANPSLIYAGQTLDVPQELHS